MALGKRRDRRAAESDERGTGESLTGTRRRRRTSCQSLTRTGPGNPGHRPGQRVGLRLPHCQPGGRHSAKVISPPRMEREVGPRHPHDQPGTMEPSPQSGMGRRRGYGSVWTSSTGDPGRGGMFPQPGTGAVEPAVLHAPPGTDIRQVAAIRLDATAQFRPPTDGPRGRGRGPRPTERPPALPTCPGRRRNRRTGRRTGDPVAAHQCRTAMPPTTSAPSSGTSRPA